MRYFIADTHFGDDAVITMFPRTDPKTDKVFGTLQEHDDWLLGEINKRVQPNDELFILGDFTRKSPGRYRMRINCKHVKLILGNHDPVKKSRNVFGDTPTILKTKLRKGDESLNTILCHYPMAFWDGSHRGWAHLYGHCHGRREITMNRGLGWGRKAIDVGVDSLIGFGSRVPISEVELFNVLSMKSGHDLVEFYRREHE